MTRAGFVFYPIPRRTRGGRNIKAGWLTLRYSLEASWYSLVIVEGAGPANMRITAKIPKLTKTPTAVYRATFLPSSGGG
jgi:hypothetical protein